MKYEKIKELATSCKLNKKEAEAVLALLQGLEIKNIEEFQTLQYKERLGVLELLELKKIKGLESLGFKSIDDLSYLYLKNGNNAVQVYIKTAGTADICTSCKKIYRERLTALGCSFKGTAENPKTAVVKAVPLDDLSGKLLQLLQLFTACEASQK